jgi:HD-GYP domain-containing protein (c-di-GMP phosphodiesterase class II)
MNPDTPIEYVEISITIIAKIRGELPFDLFLRRSADAFTKIFKKSDTIDQERLDHYSAKKGIDQLYVRTTDYGEYFVYVEKIANQLFATPKTAKTEELLEVIKEMAVYTGKEITGFTALSPQAVEHAAQTVTGCLGVLEKDPAGIAKIFKMISTHPYGLKHSMTTTIFTLLIAKADGLDSKRSLVMIGLGAMVHDVGMSLLKSDIEGKEHLTPEEWADMKEHPAVGARSLDGVRSLPEEVRQIVLQHHEQPNGHGYPNRLHGQQLYHPAKIVAVADAFSALISKRPFREQPFTPAKAIDLMTRDHGKYDPGILKRLSDLVIRTN